MHQLTYSASGSLEWGSFVLVQSRLICSGISWEGEYKQGRFACYLLLFSNITKNFKHLFKNHYKREDTIFCTRDIAQMSDTIFRQNAESVQNSSL